MLMGSVGRELDWAQKQLLVSDPVCPDLSWKDPKVGLTQLLGTGIIWRLLLVVICLQEGEVLAATGS